VVQRVAHDSSLFTQGMVFHQGLLYESGGGYRASRLLARTLEKTQPLTQLRLPRNWFGEGIAVLDQRLYLLTWREGIAQSYRIPSLQPVQQFRYDGEGWGLASDGHALIQSDGSHVLRWRNPVDFRVMHSLPVRAGPQPLARLNELEWVNGWLLANVWLSDNVVGIDPRSGCALWTLSLAGLLNERERRNADVLNGIAWEESTGLLWASGKLWPWMFALQIELPPLPQDAALTADACPG
jgi:glutaminyl-peptide cyclotransferase